MRPLPTCKIKSGMMIGCLCFIAMLAPSPLYIIGSLSLPEAQPKDTKLHSNKWPLSLLLANCGFLSVMQGTNPVLHAIPLLSNVHSDTHMFLY